MYFSSEQLLMEDWSIPGWNNTRISKGGRLPSSTSIKISITIILSTPTRISLLDLNPFLFAAMVLFSFPDIILASALGRWLPVGHLLQLVPKYQIQHNVLHKLWELATQGLVDLMSASFPSQPDYGTLYRIFLSGFYNLSSLKRQVIITWMVDFIISNRPNLQEDTNCSLT